MAFHVNRKYILLNLSVAKKRSLLCHSYDKFTEFLSSFQFLFPECDEWNACYLCTTISFKEFTSNVVADGNKTQRYETLPVTPV